MYHNGLNIRVEMKKKKFILLCPLSFSTLKLSGAKLNEIYKPCERKTYFNLIPISTFTAILNSHHDRVSHIR